MARRLAYRQHAVNNDEAPPSRTPAAEAFSRLAILVLRVGGFLTAAGDDLSRPFGQTSARWQVLAAVEDESAPVAEIARRLGLARQSVQRIADILTDEGLTAFDDNPAHRRAKLLRLLPKGRSVLNAIQAAQRPWAEKMGAAIGETDLRRAGDVLERVLQSLAGPMRD
jgi:DNA-binding MarR family transcriptional regulator